MKKLMKLMQLLAVAIIASASGNVAFAQTPYRIAVMPFGMTEYMSSWTKAMREHPMVKDGTVKMTVLDGKFDAMVQSNQIDTAITQQYDAIIFAPMDYQAAGAPIARAAAANIPVVSSVTRAGSDQLFAYIGTNDTEGGRMVTTALIEKLNGKGNIVLIEGPIGNSPQVMRRIGIDEVLKANPGVKLLAAKTANWSRAEGLAVMENWLSLYGDKINGVIAENDEMALGVIEAMRSKKIDPATVPVVSMDGVPDGQRAVRDGHLFTLFKDPKAEGQGAMDLAIRSIAGPSYQPKADIWGNGVQWKDGTAKQYDVPWVPLTQANIGNYLK
jgi:putative xylitol transport system substrate-binding protein